MKPFHTFLALLFYFVCVNVFCMFVCASHVCLHPQRPKEGIKFPDTGHVGAGN